MTAVQLIKITRGFRSKWYVSCEYFCFSCLKLTSKIICMPVCVTMSQKVYKIQSSMKSRILTDFFSVLARDSILLNDFHDANDAFRCSLLVEINTEISKMAV